MTSYVTAFIINTFIKGNNFLLGAVIGVVKQRRCSRFSNSHCVGLLWYWCSSVYNANGAVVGILALITAFSSETIILGGRVIYAVKVKDGLLIENLRS